MTKRQWNKVTGNAAQMLRRAGWAREDPEDPCSVWRHQNKWWRGILYQRLINGGQMFEGQAVIEDTAWYADFETFGAPGVATNMIRIFLWVTSTFNVLEAQLFLHSGQIATRLWRACTGTHFAEGRRLRMHSRGTAYCTMDKTMEFWEPHDIKRNYATGLDFLLGETLEERRRRNVNRGTLAGRLSQGISHYHADHGRVIPSWVFYYYGAGEFYLWRRDEEQLHHVYVPTDPNEMLVQMRVDTNEPMETFYDDTEGHNVGCNIVGARASFEQLMFIMEDLMMHPHDSVLLDVEFWRKHVKEEDFYSECK